MPAVLTLDSFRGVYPALTKVKIPAGGAEISVNNIFRNGDLDGVPKAKVAFFLQPTTVSVVPDGEDFRQLEYKASWLRVGDRTVVTGGDYLSYFSTGSFFRVGFALNRSYLNGADTENVAANVARTIGTGENGLSYVFFVEYENSQGDTSELLGAIDIANNNILGSGDTATVSVNKPVLQEGEEIAYINVYATQGGATPSLIKRLVYSDSQPADFTFIPATNYPGIITKPIYQTQSAEGRERSAPNLKKVLAHPNGFYVGFYGKYVSFSETGRFNFPYDWDLDIGWEVSDIVEYENDIWVFGIGEVPILVRVQNPQFPQIVTPDMNYRFVGGAVASNNGVLFMSISGLTHTSSTLLTKGKYNEKTIPDVFEAISIGDTYIAREARKILLIDFRTVTNDYEISEISIGDFIYEQIFLIYNKLYIVANNALWFIDFSDKSTSSWRWKSGEIRFDQPVNIGAVRIFSECDEQEQDFDNNGLSFLTLPYQPSSSAAERKGSSFSDCQSNIKIFADGEVVADEPILNDVSGYIINLPASYQAQTYQIELAGNDRVESVEFGWSRADFE